MADTSNPVVIPCDLTTPIQVVDTGWCTRHVKGGTKRKCRTICLFVDADEDPVREKVLMIEAANAVRRALRD